MSESKTTAFPKGTIVKYGGVPCELLQDTPYYSKTFSAETGESKREQEAGELLPGLNEDETRELKMLSKMTLQQAGHRGWARINILYGKVLDALGDQFYG
jgi:hypothetical protein